MKKCSWLYVILLLFTLTGCVGINRVNEPVVTPHNAFIGRMLFADENLYAIRSAGGFSYISHESSEPAVCYRLAELAGDNYGDALLHESSGRLYYSDGHKVYSSDLTGNDKQLLWKFPRERKEDRVRIMSISKDCLVVRASFWWSGQYPNSDYYSVNIHTGDAVKLMDEVPASLYPVVLCCYENTAMLVQKDGQHLRVLSFDLLTGESTELGQLDYEERIYDADGVVLNDTLYFVCENYGIYSVPLSGGTIECRWPDTTQIPSMNRLISMEVYDDALYVLMRYGNDRPPTALCRWDAKTGILYPVAATANTFSATGFLMADNMYYLFAGAEYLSGELSAENGSQN